MTLNSRQEQDHEFNLTARASEPLRRRATRALIVVTLATALTTQTAAANESRQSYEAELTSARPGSATGLRQEIRYRDPANPDGKPHAVERVVFRLPAGSRIDTSVPAQCKASEAQFQLQGRDACPPSTIVGAGSLSADSGLTTGVLPRVIETDVTFFNNEDELILFAQSTNTPTPIRVASRIRVTDREFISTVPPLPGAPPPDPFLALKDVVNNLEMITGPGGDAYITTPPRCPKSGKWTVTAEFTYRDGVTQTEESTTTCRRPDRRGPRLLVRGIPDEQCICKGFRIRVRARDRSGVRSIAVRLDGRRLRSTSRKRLSVWVPARRLEGGAHRLVVRTIDQAKNRTRKSIRFSRCRTD